MRPSEHLIELRSVTKTYQGAAGTFVALRGIDLEVHTGEFVAVIGKSGSGKSTLINMITGIDAPSAGEVWVANVAVHTLGESALARWRGRNVGVVFQFFQLLPTLTLLENVMLPMDFCNTFPPPQRPARALGLLAQMGLADLADKLPATVSGGQQQRAAIARALANDPSLIVADEPTGNLDSRTADQVFDLFEDLARHGKTIVMVTHDDDLARRANRTLIVADGQVVSEYVAQALATLDVDQMTLAASRLRRQTYAPGALVVRQGEVADDVFIIVRGHADVLLARPGGEPIPVNRLGPGQYFGEVGVLQSSPRTATVRACADSDLELMVLGGDVFRGLVAESPSTRDAIEQAVARYAGLGARTIE
jgi:ABC-type lipoprotein export system ATPase subunit